MDPRIRQHAEILVEHCVKIEPDDDVYVRAPSMAEDLMVALAEKIGEIGANPSFELRNSRLKRAYVRAADENANEFHTEEHTLAKMEETDAVIIVKGSPNVSEMSDVPSSALTSYRQAQKPIQDAREGMRWVGTQFPATGEAQRAEMSTEAYEEFVYEAVNKDWEAQREHQEQLVELLDPADEVRIVSGDTTDVTMSVADRTAINDYGEKNLPGGEVFTSPVASSVEGEVLFDKPLLVKGTEIENAYLQFEAGEVVEHDADANADVLADLLDTDEGAHRLGELGIGMNRDIDQFTYNTLFDEKMGDTVHMAIGRGFGECLPEGEEANQSAVHVDMIVDMAEDSYIELDGEVIQRDGTFRFEESED